MTRSYYRCCCINEPVMFSHCVHLKLGHQFRALLKVCSDRDAIVSVQGSRIQNYMYFASTLNIGLALFFQKPKVVTCVLCGTQGHNDRQCPKALCFICSEVGHQIRECPNKKLRYMTCHRCCMQGHSAQVRSEEILCYCYPLCA